MKFNIGIHANECNNVIIQKIIKYNINYLQIFPNIDIKTIKKVKQKYNINIIVHSSYTINLAKQFESYSIFLEECINNIKYTSQIGAKYTVVHLGKSKEATAIDNIVISLLYIINKTKEYDVIVLLETSSGQGTEVGWQLEDFKKIYDRVKHTNKVKVCLDTCHVYTAGYDLNNFDKFKSKFDELIGLDNIKVVHLNNSKYLLGDKIDRHSNLNDGNINNLAEIAFWFMQTYNTIIILETPEHKIDEDILSLTI
jgi:deoxyribonuclease-4